MVEHHVYTVYVGGSTPSSSTKVLLSQKTTCIRKCCGVEKPGLSRLAHNQKTQVQILPPHPFETSERGGTGIHSRLRAAGVSHVGSTPTVPTIFLGDWAKGWPPVSGTGHQVSSILTSPTIGLWRNWQPRQV